MEGNNGLRITKKGKAFLAAVDAGLIPETNGEYDESAFEQFWNDFSTCFEENNRIIIKDLHHWQSLCLSVLAIVLSVIALIAR